MSHNSSHHTKTAVAKSSFLDYFDEGSLTEWLSLHGKNILYGLAGFLAVLTLVFAFTNRRTSQNEQDYIHAANDFTRFSQVGATYDAAAAQSSLDRLTILMKDHPELHANYDGAIAQTLLNRGQTDTAKSYASATLARVKPNNLPLYTDYAATTLLISQENYQEALKQALALQQTMNETLSATNRTFGDELFALNLLRVGMLQQAVGDAAGEAQTWKEWRQLAGLNRSQSGSTVVSPQAFREVIQELAIGSTSLLDYIAYRERVLNSTSNR
jgi:hypothetical protein